MNAPPQRSELKSVVDPAADRERRMRRPWRVLFALYTIAMMVGIHWPRLHMGVGDVPAPDKVIHFAAFAGLAFLLWATAWVRRLLLLWMVMMVWTYAVEFTQSFPGLGRTFSWWDVVAGWLGVTSLVLILRALAPLGKESNRLRLRMDAFAVQEIFGRPAGWIAVSFAGAVMAAIFGGCAGYFFYRFDPLHSYPAMVAAAIGGMCGGTVGAAAMADALTRRRRSAISRSRPCFDCGESCAEGQVDARGYGACPRCGGTFHLGQWMMQPPLPIRLNIQLAFAIFIALLLAAFIGALLPLIQGYPHEVPTDFLAIVPIAVFCAGLAAAIRAVRKTIASAVDAQAERCRLCGHDVHATPTTHGIGRCGECGTTFVRV